MLKEGIYSKHLFKKKSVCLNKNYNFKLSFFNNNKTNSLLTNDSIEM